MSLQKRCITSSLQKCLNKQLKPILKDDRYVYREVGKAILLKYKEIGPINPSSS